MRARLSLVVLAIALAPASAGWADEPLPPPPPPVAAQPVAAAPAPAQAAGPIALPPPRRSSAKAPLAITGGALAGVGAITVFAAGVTWLVAYAESRSLSSECPDGKCVEGTTGGDSYVAARDGGHAADVLVGIGVPVFTAGIVLLLYASALGPSRREATVLAHGATMPSAARFVSVRPDGVGLRF